LKSHVQQTLQIKDSEFFEYEIQSRVLDSDNSFFLLEFFPKQQTEIYISATHVYPNQAEHRWAFGDLPLEVVERAKANPFMRDILTEASPFDISPTG
jgi:hypothetical protein